LNFLSEFSWILGIGATLGLWRVYNSLHPAQTLKGLTAAIITLCGGLLVGRIGFVLTHMQFFAVNRLQIPQFWLGGLNGFGALAGAILFAILAATALKMQLMRTLDLLTRQLLPLGVAVWLGCWAIGLAYGQALDQGTWWGMRMLDETGVTSLRVPLQPVAAFSLLIILLLVERFAKNTWYGVFFTASGLVFSLHTLLFSCMRADPVQYFFSLRLDVILSIISSFGFLILLAFLIIRGRKKDKMRAQDLVNEVKE
jgi:prolipoprotein diacylglyceryltransferase